MPRRMPLNCIHNELPWSTRQVRSLFARRMHLSGHPDHIPRNPSSSYISLNLVATICLTSSHPHGRRFTSHSTQPYPSSSSLGMPSSQFASRVDVPHATPWTSPRSDERKSPPPFSLTHAPTQFVAVNLM